MLNISKVRVWEEEILIPTYPTAKPDKNPLFLEKRVYQGSSGKVYPHPVTDKLLDQKTDKVYKTVFLENDYLRIMILPELGGRIQRAYDKQKDYDFVYYNRVIKPALVGLAGPWISGGIEFNWPQHHRPSTFDPVNYTYKQNADGSASVICSEIEGMFHTKGETVFTLYPDKAYLKLENHLFNRTNMRQTFLWWANPAVAVNEQYRSIFPPDVTAVMDHGKRAVATFPIATGTYYKVDYSKGVDISRYKNLPVPTSYMAAKSDFDFVGGYDDGVGAGILHVADHHISPGKKQWTWGCGDFGKAWDRNLTDEDGPYVELMTGCYTDNQPDFSYIGPMETRSFVQYFLPYHELGTVHNASENLALRLDVDKNITVNLYCSGSGGECTVRILANQNVIYEKLCRLACGKNYAIRTENEGYSFEDIAVEIVQNGRVCLSFDGNVQKQPIPEAAQPAPEPSACATNEDLYLYGLHMEQYRHATRRAEPYYLEGLRRDPTDIRLNLAYGLLLLKKGYFKKSEQHFKAAVNKQIRSNPNPISGEAYYALGLSLFYQNRLTQAYDAFYKATWNAETQSNAWFYLALIAAQQKNYEEALRSVENALQRNTVNANALNLKTMLLKVTGRDFLSAADYALSLDPLNLLALHQSGTDIKKHILNPAMLIDLSLEYAFAGFYKDALALLDLDESGSPLVLYYKAFYANRSGLAYAEYLKAAACADSTCCFPNRVEDILVLRFACAQNPQDFAAPYYLGNLFYDQERHADAIACFEASVALGCDFPTPYRNLSLLYYNIKKDGAAALKQMETAFAMDESDGRVLYELDLLRKKLGVSPKLRLDALKAHFALIQSRDDLYLEYITLLNLTGDYKTALHALVNHRFHPWEGGEGKVPEQYLFCNIALACQCVAEKNPTQAIAYLSATFTYPENLGEGKLFGAQENRQNYYLGRVYACAGEAERAAECFRSAAHGILEPTSAVYYNDQPPETIFYQGMALQRLGRSQEATDRFMRLIAYADAHMQDDVTIDYFAVSLPDLLVFEEDLNRKNQLHCLFIKALGLYGLGEVEQSHRLFEQALQMNPNAFQIATHYQLLFKEVDACVTKSH